jgi:DNA recombination protein RmuC
MLFCKNNIFIQKYMELIFFVLGFLIGTIIIWFFLSKKNEIIKKEYLKEREERIKIQADYNNFVKNQNFLEKQIKQSIESNILTSMKTNNESFISLASQIIEKYFVQAEKGLKEKTVEIDKIILPLQKSIENYDKKITDFQQYTSQGLGGIKTYLSELTLLQNNLSKLTNSLVAALKNPKIRGRWGEIGLRRIVEYAGLNQYCDFTEQAKSDINLLRPDLIINLPENKKIIIDSKLPLDSYIAALEVESEEEKERYLKKHLAAIKENLKRLSSKAYWELFEDSIDFVVMYIDIEPAFSTALMMDNNLINEALQQRIIISTPTTFIALLQTVAYSWKQNMLSENAFLILKEVKELYSRFAVYTEHFEKLGKNINSLVDGYNATTNSWKTRIEPALKRIEELGMKDEKKRIKQFDNLDKI